MKTFLALIIGVATIWFVSVSTHKFESGDCISDYREGTKFTWKVLDYSFGKYILTGWYSTDGWGNPVTFKKSTLERKDYPSKSPIYYIDNCPNN